MRGPNDRIQNVTIKTNVFLESESVSTFEDQKQGLNVKNNSDEKSAILSCPKDFVQLEDICYNWKNINLQEKVMNFHQGRE